MSKDKKSMMKRLVALVVTVGSTAVIGIGGVGGCGSSSSTGGGGGGTPTTGAAAVILNYANIALAAYTDSVTTAEALHDAIDAFIGDPTEENFEAAREAWIASREPYEQTEAYRFYDGPIDGDDGNPEILINAWPLDENYIDYVNGEANAGIINDAGVDISAESLVELNGKDTEATLTTGYHSIEFLLWGQDLNANPEDTGLRAFTDFVDGGTNANQDRRRAFLETTAHLLVEHLTEVRDEWKADVGGNYRSEFISVDTKEALRRIIIGLGSFASGELASQRIDVALFTKSQEDEHSCFSDNTHRDLRQGLQSILNIYFGTYTKLDGTAGGDGNGLEDLIQTVNAARNTQIKIHLNNALAALNEVDAKAKDGNHFDQQILDDEDRANIEAAIDALNAFTDELSLAAGELGVDINLDPDGD